MNEAVLHLRDSPRQELRRARRGARKSNSASSLLNAPRSSVGVTEPAAMRSSARASSRVRKSSQRSRSSRAGKRGGRRAWTARDDFSSALNGSYQSGSVPRRGFATIRRYDLMIYGAVLMLGWSVRHRVHRIGEAKSPANR